ncbi:monocarboxylate transporter 14-like [Amphiura filiformis]|uniref:monocarboxylate transporter 14-like n=1 Tax=Amphiura filiformis TaxID=82378 RepID=UPI003B219954
MASILEEFNVGSAAAGWICSLAYATQCIAGPLTSVVVNNVHYRWVVMAGGTLQAVGMMTTYLANSTSALFITLGIIPGLGASLVYISQPIIITSYFTKYCGTMIGIVFAGCASAVFVLPPLINFLISTYGWRSALLIQGALIFHVVAIGATYQLSRRPEKKADWNDPDIDDKALKQFDETGATKSSGISSGWFPSHIILLMDTPILVLVYLTSFFVNMAYTAAIIHSSNQITISGYSKDGAFVLSLLGIASVCGRFVQGIVVDVFRVSPMTLYEVTLIVAAASTFVNPLINNYAGFMVSAFGTGFTTGILFTVMYVMLLQLTGISHLATAVGMELFVDCLGIMTGAYLAGAIHDITGNYKLGFYVFGATYILGACVFFPVYFADRKKGRGPRYEMWMERKMN